MSLVLAWRLMPRHQGALEGGGGCGCGLDWGGGPYGPRGYKSPLEPIKSQIRLKMP